MTLNGIRYWIPGILPEEREMKKNAASKYKTLDMKLFSQLKLSNNL